MSINERFFYLLEKNNITQKEFSQKTGIPTQTISGWKTRKTDPPANLISSIADFFNVSCDFILTGNEKSNECYYYSNNNEEFLDTFSLLSKKDQEEIIEFMKLKLRLSKKVIYDVSNDNYCMVAESESIYKSNRPISILGYVAAGEPILSFENEINTISPENDKVSYALIAKGNSMEPIIMDGEIIEVISQCELENGEIGIIKLNGAVTCKCFYSLDNRYELKSLNPDIKPIIVPKGPQSEIQIVGKVALTYIQKSRYNKQF